jgi:hypothetical protein
MTFVGGEQALSTWIAENAYVSWVVRHHPWELEDTLIAALDLPFNLTRNRHNQFHPDSSHATAALRGTGRPARSETRSIRYSRISMWLPALGIWVIPCLLFILQRSPAQELQRSDGYYAGGDNRQGRAREGGASARKTGVCAGQ